VDYEQTAEPEIPSFSPPRVSANRLSLPPPPPPPTSPPAMTPTSDSGSVTPEYTDNWSANRQEEPSDGQWDETRQAWLDQSQDAAGSDVTANQEAGLTNEEAELAAGSSPSQEEDEKASKKNKRKSFFSMMSSQK